MERARGSGRPEALAFALGWWGHLAADEVGDAAGAVTTVDLFGLGADLYRVACGMNKILIDGMLRRRTGKTSLDVRVHEMGLLVEAVVRSPGQGREPDVRAKLGKLQGSYEQSVDVLADVAHLVSINPRLVADLERTAIGASDRYGVADVERSVAAVTAVLLGHAAVPEGSRTGEPAPGSTAATSPSTRAGASGGTGSSDGTRSLSLLGVGSGAAAAGDAGSSRVDRVTRLYEALGAALPSAGGIPAFRWLRDETVRVTASVALFTIGSRAGHVVDVKKRVLIAFCLKLVDRDCSLQELQKAVLRAAH